MPRPPPHAQVPHRPRESRDSLEQGLDAADAASKAFETSINGYCDGIRRVSAKLGTTMSPTNIA